MEYILNCPVCTTEVEWYEICSNCGYQNSGPNEKLDGPKGPNKMSLGEAKKSYEKNEKVE